MTVKPIFAVILIFFVGASLGQTESLETRHLTLGRQLLSSLKPENTAYRHSGRVYWQNDNQESESRAFTDCSGLINSLLERAAITQIEGLNTSARHGSPKARDYYRQIVAENGFRRIEFLANVRAGDLLAIEYPPGDENTGHVMLIDTAPVPRKSATPPLIENTVQWEVRVIDSTQSPHGREDNRRSIGGRKRNGVGHGILRIYADSKDRPVGYSWSTLSSSIYRGARDRPLAIGRISPKPANQLQSFGSERR